MVVEGKIRLHRKEREIAVVSNKESFGAWALFDSEPRLATATTVEDSHILRISKEDFMDLISDNTTITESVFRALVKQVRGLVERRPEG
jgi:CRP-like cAMP-binding protein